MSKKAEIITRNYTGLDNREVIVIFDTSDSFDISVGLDILENKHEQCDRVHLSRSEVRELYLMLRQIYD